MTDKEKRAVEEEIRSLEASKREFEDRHPENVDRIRAMQNMIDGKRKYIKGWR